jgi:hypothetical protein
LLDAAKRVPTTRPWMVATLPTRPAALCQLTAPLHVSEAWACADVTRVAAVAIGTAAVAAMRLRARIRFKRAPSVVDCSQPRRSAAVRQLPRLRDSHPAPADAWPSAADVAWGPAGSPTARRSASTRPSRRRAWTPHRESGYRAVPVVVETDRGRGRIARDVRRRRAHRRSRRDALTRPADPPIRDDVRCAFCGKRRPEAAVAFRDPFCSADHSRVYFVLPPVLDERAGRGKPA